MDKVTPPHPGPPPFRPPNLIQCPGCDKMISRTLIACGRHWRQVPGTLKAALTATKPATFGRARVVAEMRNWLQRHAE